MNIASGIGTSGKGRVRRSSINDQKGKYRMTETETEVRLDALFPDWLTENKTSLKVIVLFEFSHMVSLTDIVEENDMRTKPMSVIYFFQNIDPLPAMVVYENPSH